MPATPDAARLITCPPEDFRRASEAALATARSGIERLKVLPAPRKPREALACYAQALKLKPRDEMATRLMADVQLNQ